MGSLQLLDFLKGAGGENLEAAVLQREDVKRYLTDCLIALEAIDEDGNNKGLYVKA